MNKKTNNKKKSIFKQNFINFIKDFKLDGVQFFKITLGTYLMVFSFYFLFTANGLVTGGVGGFSQIIVELIKKSSQNSPVLRYISFFTLILNVSLLIIGAFFLGKKFFAISAYTSLLYPLLIWCFETISNNNAGILINGILGSKFFINETIRPIICALMGSAISGVGLGLVFGAGGTTGGTDVLQKIINKFLKLPLSIAIYLTDGIIVLLGIITFKLENVLISVLSIFLIGFFVDRVIMHGKKGFTAFIITSKPETLKEKIIKKLDRGLTKIDVKGGYTDISKSLIICTVKINQVFLLKELIKENSDDVFSFFIETTEVYGSGFEKERKK